MSEEQQGQGAQSPQEGTAPVAPQEGSVQPPQTDKAVLEYRELQSRHDSAQHQVTTLEEANRELPRVKEQAAKLVNENKQLRNQVIVTELVSANPHLKKLAELQDFSGMSPDDISEWGQAATEALNSVGGAAETQPDGGSNVQPEGTEAPDVGSGKAASAGSGQGQMSAEAFKQLDKKAARDYLISAGLL
jgi:hypothetical protein